MDINLINALLNRVEIDTELILEEKIVFQKIRYINKKEDSNSLNSKTLYIIPSKLFDKNYLPKNISVITDKVVNAQNEIVILSNITLQEIYEIIMEFKSLFHSLKYIVSSNRYYVENNLINIERSLRNIFLLLFQRLGISIGYLDLMDKRILTQNKTIRLNTDRLDNVIQNKNIFSLIQELFPTYNITEDEFLIVTDNNQNIGAFFPNQTLSENWEYIIYHEVTNILVHEFTCVLKREPIHEYQKFIVDSLIQGKNIKVEVLENYLNSLNIFDETVFQLLEFFPNQTAAPLSIYDNQFRSKLTDIIGSHFLTIYDENIIALRTKAETKYNQKVLDDFISNYNHLSVSSSKFYQIQSINHAYHQIQGLFNINEYIYEGQDSFIYDDYYLKVLHVSINRNQFRKDFCHMALLENLDFLKSNIEIVKILYVYLLSGLNKSLTSERLFIHRNTLSNKIENINNLLKINIDEISDSEKMWLLLSIHLLFDDISD